MNFRRIAYLTALGTAVASLALAGGASAATLSGVVVHKNSHAHSFVLASRGGHMTAVHGAAAVGHRAKVAASRLRNGTFKARSVRVGRAARHARVRGVVTYASARRHMFVVSSRGVSLLVHSARARGARARS